MFQLMIAVNDYLNGRFSGKLMGFCLMNGNDICIEVLGLLCEANCKYDYQNKIFSIDNKINIKYEKRIEWIGNWCWDQINFYSTKDLMKFLRYLAEKWGVKDPDIMDDLGKAIWKRAIRGMDPKQSKLMVKLCDGKICY